MSKSTKLPKRIAGVKIPKPLRQAAAAVLEQAATPAGRQLIAAALTASAAALTRGMPAAAESEKAEGTKPKPPIDMGALLGFAATSVIGGLKAAGERRNEGAPAKPGEA
ncbi:hypothetical protein [uncultured Sphingomonas sp.]|uniref:hypothetical protein n=1 Tax=uncultured Sphingomonas sp. TaxID=158754 RepID=UPI0035CBA407